MCTLIRRAVQAMFLILCFAHATIAAELSVSADPTLPELHESIDVVISGRSVVTNSLTLQVLRGATDVSTQVSIQQSGLDVDDPDQNGVAESLVADYTVTFTSLDPTAGDDLTFVASASTGGETLVSRAVTKVIPHVGVQVNSDFPTGTSDSQPVFIEVEDVAAIQSVAIRAMYLGNDVTSLVNFTSPALLDQIAGPGGAPSVAYQSSTCSFDPTALGASANEVIEVVVTVQTPQGATSSSGVSVAMAFSTPTATVRTAFSTFIEKLKLMDGEGGAVCVTATAAEIKAAADEFQDAVKDEPNPGPIDEPNGPGTDSSGSAKHFHVKGAYSKQGGRDASMNGNADVVVAMGGDGASGSTTKGASASATNTNGGGAAIAVAGDGADGGSSGGTGANADATGKSTSGQNDNGSAIAIGGDGGDPSPDDKKGGSGGTASSKVSGSESSNSNPTAGSAGSGNPPSAGTHGLGKWARRDKGANGSGPGPSDPKSETNAGG